MLKFRLNFGVGSPWNMWCCTCDAAQHVKSEGGRRCEQVGWTCFGKQVELISMQQSEGPPPYICRTACLCAAAALGCSWLVLYQSGAASRAVHKLLCSVMRCGDMLGCGASCCLASLGKSIVVLHACALCRCRGQACRCRPPSAWVFIHTELLHTELLPYCAVLLVLHTGTQELHAGCSTAV